MNILVFDIETIPDLESGAKLYNLHGLNDEDTAKAMMTLRRNKVGNDFLPHYLQKIIAISLVLQQNNNIMVWSLGNENSTEAEIIQRFFSGVEKYKPTLVSWNGSGFDLPVLHYRSLLHGIPAATYWEIGGQQQDFRWNNYLNRFHYRHLDLMDVLAAYQNKAFAPLHEIAIMLGFPGKLGMDGNQVWQQYLEGNIKEIRDYCEIDVLNTYCIYLRFELIRGLLSKEKYDEALLNLIISLEQEPEKAHWQEFLDNISHKF